jgi:hypothetical protein
MPEIRVKCTDPPPPEWKRLDLNDCLPVRLRDHLLDSPGYSDWWLYHKPDPVRPLWFVGFYPFVRITESPSPDGSLKARNPDGSIDTYRSTGAVEGNRRYDQVSIEIAKTLVRDCAVNPPPGFFPATPPDALQVIRDLIPQNHLAFNMIQWLAERQGRKAKAEEICKAIYKSVDKKSYKKTTLLIKRTMSVLEKRNASLRLQAPRRIRRNDEIKLIDADPTEAT